MKRFEDSESAHDDALPTINRLALVVEPKAAFVRWYRRNPQGEKALTLKDLEADASVYLLPSVTETDFDEWLEQNYQRIFEQELIGWFIDENHWPEDRSFAVFKKYFKVSLHPMVYDLDRTPLEREERL